MSDQTNLDQIHWWQSGVIIKQIVVISCMAAGALGYAVTPEDQAVIISGVLAAAAAVSAIFSIVDRIKKPLPQVSNKLIPTKGETK